LEDSPLQISGGLAHWLRTSGDELGFLLGALLVQSRRLQLGSRLGGQTREQFLDLGDGPTGVEALGAGARAVHDRVAPVDAEGVLQLAQPLGGVLVTRIDDPAVGLHEHGGAQVLLGVPPVRGARGGAAGAQDALVQTVQFGAVLDGLQVLGLALLLAGFVPA